MENTTVGKTDALLTGDVTDKVSSLNDSFAEFNPLKNESIKEVPLVSTSNVKVPPVPPRSTGVKLVTNNLDTIDLDNKDEEQNEFYSTAGDNKPSSNFSIVDPFQGDDPFSYLAAECEQFNQRGASSSVLVSTSEDDSSDLKDIAPSCLNKSNNKISATSDTSTRSEWNDTVNNSGYMCTSPVSKEIQQRESLYTSVDDMADDNHAVTNNPKPNSRRLSGYLYKQGGLKGNKGWKKRWIVFNGRDIRYYDDAMSQISKRIVPVLSMKRVILNAKSSDKRRFKFDLETKFRTFLFAAESLDECNMWTNCLMEAIIHYFPSSEGDVEGGDMCNPDIKGYVKFLKEKSKYVAIKRGLLCYYNTEQDFKNASPIHEIEMKLVSVKDIGKNQLEISTHYLFVKCLVFDSRAECLLWKNVMEEAIKFGLEEDNTNLYEVAEEPK